MNLFFELIKNTLEPFDAYENWDRSYSKDKKQNEKFTVG
jgi:hypothetical protein